MQEVTEPVGICTIPGDQVVPGHIDEDDTMGGLALLLGPLLVSASAAAAAPCFRQEGGPSRREVCAGLYAHTAGRDLPIGTLCLQSANEQGLKAQLELRCGSGEQWLLPGHPDGL